MTKTKGSDRFSQHPPIRIAHLLDLGLISEGERIRWVPKYEGVYAATEAGVVISFHGHPAARTPVNPDTNPSVQLSKNGSQLGTTVARCVWSAFYGDPAGPIGRKDGDPSNTSLSNLYIKGDSDRMQKAKEAFDGGMSMREAEARYGLGDGMLRHHLRKEGVETTDLMTPLSATQRRLIRYARWGVGMGQRKYSERIGVAASALSNWESGVTRSIHKQSRGAWGLVTKDALRLGINPDSPRRLMYPTSALDLVGELMWKLKLSVYDLSRAMGWARDVIYHWQRRTHMPSPEYYKQFRDFCELHGVWSPPDPITSTSDVDDSPEPEAELSDSDKQMIAVMHEQGTSISDLAMMYGVGLAKISDALGEG